MSRRLVLALLLASCGSAGCGADVARSSVPSMIEVADVQPRELEVGDRLEVLGSGFPLRRTAHILLRGTVHRPGLAAEPVAISIDAETRSEGRVEIPVSAQIADRLVGTGDAAMHATFRGEVVVAFSPAESGTTALTGKATNVVLDVRPERVRTRANARREESGQKLLDYLGMTPAAAAPASGGLLVSAVRSGSPGALAGVQAGDVLVDFDGVRVSALSDLAPSGDVVAIGFRREGEAELRTSTVPLAGFSQRIPRSLVAGALLVSIASALVLLGATRPSARRAFVERAIAERLRLGAGALAKKGLPSIGLVAAIAPLLPIVRITFGVDLDASALLCVAAAALFALSLADERPGAALSVARDQVPAALAAAAAVIATGSLRLDDVMRAQGPLPWDWFVFRSPAATLLFGTWMMAAASARGRRGLTEEAALVVTSVLAATLFLGGFRLPGIALEVASTWWLVAVVVFASKAALVAALVRGLSAVLPAPAEKRLHPTWRVHVPLAVLGLGATIALAAASPSTGFVRALGLGTFVAWVAVVAFAALRAASSLRKIAVRHVDPAL